MATNKRVDSIDYHNLVMPQLNADALSHYKNLTDSGKKPSLRVVIDATHSGRLTNLRVYPGKKMKDSVDTFMQPFPKPVLKHHNEDADPVGRVVSAEYIQLKSGRDFEDDWKNPKDDMGSGFCKLTVDIFDQDTIEKILDGRLRQVSTGQRNESLNCSICGEDMLTSDECGHYPGEKYKIKGDLDSSEEYLCYAITGKLKYKEVSFVNNPADSFAGVTKISADANASSVTYANADVGSLVLTDGEDEINLVTNKRKVAAIDRERLTGKAIVAVSPKFKLKSLANEDTTMTSTANADKTKNTEDVTASDTQGKPAQAPASKDNQEGVVAPDNTKDVGKDAGSLSTKDSKEIAFDAMAKSLEEAQASVTETKAEVERTKVALADKNAEIERLRKDNAELLTSLKHTYASNLLNTQILLKKPSVASVKDSESFDAKLKEYAERSLDSLKDSVKDLSIELASLKDGLGLKTTADLVAATKLSNPTANVGEDKEDKDSETFDPTSKTQALTNYFDN